MQHEQLSERSMFLADRLAFLQAKEKELTSFVENDVWVFDTMTEDKLPRIIRASSSLNWKKGDNGGRRAKARLICQGLKDPDALNGSLTTASPTLTRLSKSLVLSITSMLAIHPLHGRHHDCLPPRKEVRPWLRWSLMDQATKRLMQN